MASFSATGPLFSTDLVKVCKGAKIKNRYNQVQYLTQDTNGNKSTNDATCQI